MILEILIILIVIWMVKKSRLTKEQAALANQLKTNIKAYPIVGHTYKFFGTSEDRMEAWRAFGRDAIEAGGISKAIHFDQLIIMVADPVIAEVLLNQCLEKHKFLKILGLLIGNATLIAPVPIWRHHRKIVAPTLHMKYVMQFVEIFSEQSIRMADLLEKEVGKGTFSFWDYISECNINTICETAMGIKMNLQGKEFSEAIESLWRMAGYFVMCQPWLMNKILMKIVPDILVKKHKRIAFNFITKIYKEKQKSLKENSSSTHKGDISNSKISFFDLQVKTQESKEGFSESELIEELLQLVVAGFDTSASTQGFLVLLLGRHTDVQDKVHEELEEVFGDSDRAVTYDDLDQLKYFEAVIKETLRLYPSVPILPRDVTHDVKLRSGLTLVQGCGVAVNVWAIHRHPAYWGADADQFRPERFLNCCPTHPAALMGFGHGLRSCVGQRYAMLAMKTTLSTLLRRYRVLAPPGVPQGAPLRTKFEMVMRHVDNYEIRLERRK